MEALAEYFKVFSEPSRLAVLEALRGGPLNVTAVVEASGLSQATGLSQALVSVEAPQTSHHRRSGAAPARGLPGVLRGDRQSSVQASGPSRDAAAGHPTPPALIGTGAAKGVTSTIAACPRLGADRASHPPGPAGW